MKEESLITDAAATRLRIVELSAENLKRLKAITIRPGNNDMTVIGGNNGQGKSSTLDAIAYALGGKALIPSEPIRKGQKSAKVRVDLGELVVERRFTPSGSTLAVMSKDGAKYPSPQAILDKLVGDLTFDPLAFVTMKPEQQLETLKKVVGVSFDDLESGYHEAYEERTIVNREVKQLEGQLTGLTSHNDVPAEPVAVETVLARLKQVQEHNSAIEKLNQQSVEADRARQDTKRRIETCNEEITTLERQIETIQQRKEELEAQREAEELTALELRQSLAKAETVDPAPVMAEIQQVESLNQKVRDNQRRRELEQSIQTKRDAATEFTKRLEAIEVEKEARLSTAQFPVAALSFSDSGVLLNSLPFEQASAAEQLRVSVAMGMAMNPRLKVLLIRDGSLLDDNNLALLGDLAAKEGCQVWVERVGKGKEVSIVIEDGEVAA